MYHCSLRKRQKIIEFNYPDQAANLISKAKKIVVLAGNSLANDALFYRQGKHM
jgi:hypothetical protein